MYAASGVEPGQRIVSTYNAGPFAAGAALASFERIGLCHIPVGTGNTERLVRAIQLLEPEAVTPGLIALVADDAPTRTILCAGAGAFERANVTLTQGIQIGHPADAPEQIAARWSEIFERDGESVPESGAAQGALEIGKAMRALG